MFRPSYSRIKLLTKINSMNSCLRPHRPQISPSLPSITALPTAASISKPFSTSFSFSKNIEDDNVGTEERAPIDEEALLAEYYRSYKEEVWVAGNDDDRDVRWMEMLGNRGQEGVFDLHEMIEVLQAENVQDIVAIKVPEEMNYTDYLVIGTGFSTRHLKSVMEYVKKLHKGKRGKKDPHAIIEGLEAEDWLVVDMGNIVLHLFHPDTRDQWDLETLWTVGPEFDELIDGGKRDNAQLDDWIYVDDASEINWDLSQKPA